MRKLFCETLGTNLELPDQIERIISFSPAITETLSLIGMEDRLVGVSAFCMKPKTVQKIRKIGSYNTVQDSLLKQLEPEIIFTVTGYQREFARRIAKNFPVYSLELPVSVAGIIDMIAKTGLVINRSGEAVRLSRQLLEIVGRSKSVGKPVKVYLEIDLGGPVAFGMYSYITDALRLLGARSIYGDRPCEWLTPDLNWVREQNPDIIIYEAKMFKRFGPEDLARMIKDRGWEELDCVKNGRIFQTPGPLDFLAHHGPSFITDTLPWLESRLK